MSNFSAILNSNVDVSKKQNVLEDIHASNSSFNYVSEGFSLYSIKEGIQKLKKGKASGKDNISAEHVIYAHDSLHRLLHVFFNAAIVHSYLPQSFMDTVISPIVKDKKGDLTSEENYRPVAVTCVISKLLEILLLGKYGSFFTSTDHQFGFKNKHSTDTCIFTLKEVVNYYNSHDSPVYVAFLDASKAFDTVNHWILFDKLTARGLPSSVVRLLLNWYRSQDFFVRWCGRTSQAFKVSNGVRQGSILSPVLYNVFMDDLSVELSKSFSGCAINGQSINHLLYADDCVLLAPSPHGLQDLLRICQDYAVKCGISYGVKKSVCMCVKPVKRRGIVVPSVFLNGRPMKWIKKHRYLGVMLQDNFNDDLDIQRQLGSLYCRGNMLLRKFKNCSEDVKSTLFTTYCSNLYCAPLWCLYSTTVMERLKVAYNKSFRMFFSVRRRATSITQVSLNIVTFYALLRKSIFSFKSRILKSNNILVASINNSVYFLLGSPLKEHWTNELYCK